MNKYQVGDLVYKEGILKKIVEVNKTSLGYTYDTKEIGSDEIEICFEHTLERAR